MTPMFSVCPACEEEDVPLEDEPPPHAARVTIAAAATDSAAHGRDRPAVRSTSACISLLSSVKAPRLLAPTRCIEYRRYSDNQSSRASPIRNVGARRASP